ncbi:hypothetical protein [Streptomyces sp. NPDC051639]|uniref:hypothetical protein n=1 Tax=Streptomyces TaxID=1883 RepID=UPI003431016C
MSTTTGTPRDADGNKLCAWCGGTIQQSGIGRSKDYCRRSCRQRAYEQRETEKEILKHRRLYELLNPRGEAGSISSRDEAPEPGSNSSRDEMLSPPISSRDETA